MMEVKKGGGMEGIEIQLVSSSIDSPEFDRLKWALSNSSIIGLDAEWKPVRAHQPTFPPVLLLQIACRLHSTTAPIVFLLDLSTLHLPSVYNLLTHAFVSPNILKLGFRFKQDLLYLSSTFRSNVACDSGFLRVEPFLDIATIYSHLHQNQTRRKTKGSKSLSAICQELLGISLSKELQCSDWSLRPLSQDQISYAALDALCLIHIFDVFHHRLLKQGAIAGLTDIDCSGLNLGLKQILRDPDNSTRILRTTCCEAVEMVRATILEYPQRLHAELEASLKKSSWDTIPMDYTLLQIVRQHGDSLILTESDGKPRTSKKKKVPTANLR